MNELAIKRASDILRQESEGSVDLSTPEKLEHVARWYIHSIQEYSYRKGQKNDASDLIAALREMRSK